MSNYTRKHLEFIVDGVLLLEEVARDLAKSARKRRDSRRPRSGRNGTLRPSSQTPLWNAIVVMVKPHLKGRGNRALMARELGVHRARIGEYFDTQTAMPDAERTLDILIWLAQKQSESTPA